MKIFSNLFLLGGVAAAAITIDRKLVRRRELAGAGTVPSSNAGIVDAEILSAGIADVDPQGLVQMGEAVDPDAIEEAHESVGEQRARMPVRGRDVP